MRLIKHNKAEAAHELYIGVACQLDLHFYPVHSSVSCLLIIVSIYFGYTFDFIGQGEEFHGDQSAKMGQ